jgi:hypothetical protein
MWLPHGSLKSSEPEGADGHAGLVECGAHRLLVVDDQPEVAAFVGALLASGRQRDELVAHVDERHPRAVPAAQLDLEQASVPGERVVDVAHL